MEPKNYFTYLVYDWTQEYADAQGKTETFKDINDLRAKWKILVKQHDLSPHHYTLYVELINVIENGVRSRKLENEAKRLGKELIKEHEEKTGKKINSGY